jgi:hypothetical protein
MKPKFRGWQAIVLSIILVCCALPTGSIGQPQNEKSGQGANSNNLVVLRFGTAIPVTVQSEGVEWKGFTYHLVELGSVQFNLDKKTAHLTAEIRAGLTSFDDVDYDVSAAVFDAAGQMLGAARTICHVDRLWLGKVLRTSQTITLDFGRSLDYPGATGFMLTVSKRKVLTPDDWQKSK